MHKDKQTDTIIAQLKIKNITNKIIKAAKISILSFDTVGRQIGDEIKHEYLDLFASKDIEFGQKVPIKLTNNSTRSFSVTVNEIIFTDNSIWNYGGEEWFPLKEPKKLISIFNNTESLKQYKIEYGEKCKFEPIEDRDIWICSCGIINKQDEIKCLNCGCSLHTLKNIDLSKLNENRDKRIAIEKEKATQRKKKKAIIATICIFLIAILMIFVNYYNKLNTYNEAIELIETGNNEKISNGIKMLIEIEGFKDSEDKINEVYNQGIELFDAGKYDEAINKFEKLGDYKDSNARKQDSMLYTLLINKDFSTSFYSIEDVKNTFNVKALNSDELKNKIVGSWIVRKKEPTIIMFNADGTGNEKNYNHYDHTWNDSSGVMVWSIENDDFIINRSYSNGVNVALHYKFFSLNDDVLIAYNPISKRIGGVYSAKNSEFTEKCLEYYNMQLD